MYIKSLFISNLRCFSKEEVNFQYPGQAVNESEFPNVNLILGNNGAGKTTLLKAVSLVILSPIIKDSGFVPYHLVRRQKSNSKKYAGIEASVLLHEQDVLNEKKLLSEPVNLKIVIKRLRDIETLRTEPLLDMSRQEQWEEMYNDKSPAFLIIGYGANRRVEASETFDSSVRKRQRLLRYQRVSSLFEEQITLIPLTRWLPEYKKENPDRHKQVANLINRLLPKETKFEGERDDNEYFFTHKRVIVPFSAMSDGFRAYIGWITDLLYHICMGCPPGKKLTHTCGIVLVDEIDLHIHPEWQRTIIPRIAKALPDLQFVFTSHSPIVAGTLEKSNLFVTESSSGGTAKVRQFDEDIYGLNADQILLSSYFGLKSTRAASIFTKLDELAKKAQDGDKQAAIEYLETLIPSRKHKNH